MLVALYERVVGFYASMVGINAYHQPGVEAGKKAAGSVIALKQKITATLQASPGKQFTAEELATELGSDTSAELVFKILEHLGANRGSGVRKRGKTPWYQSRYSM
jgi:glucose-6-phosphate isomerase